MARRLPSIDLDTDPDCDCALASIDLETKPGTRKQRGKPKPKLGEMPYRTVKVTMIDLMIREMLQNRRV